MSDTITIVGIIGTDPEKKNANGLTITTFRVGSTQRRLDRATGAWVDGETSWYTVSAYRRLAEHAFDSLKKKDRVILTGRLRVRRWESGEKRGTAVEIDVDAIGHDLLWGTTSFTRDVPVSGSSAPQSDDAWAPGSTSEESWATPGLEQTGHAESSGEAVNDEGAAGGFDSEKPVLALTGAETPF
ncbi:single-stranded DNA-binding protein [Microbacterium sp.]|uniref:single-stranded DNA-binding protein n=1 Tax=Microbacterium sp. TaxID=51671 RepID=UPI002E340193|nr:single-stranded DNA-binding protein [Microbacterium sp.]HEX5729263.1 single-stranded DNA-binding protein [Microbacterium sp.]